MKEKKKLLIFAHYYVPDVASSGQVLQDLAEGLTECFDVTVICTVPSYTGIIDKVYKTKNYYYEELNRVKIIRVSVPEYSKNNKFSRIRNIITYFVRAIIACNNSGEQNYIFTISQPPILGGILGVIGKRIKKAKFIYNIQDYNPEQTLAVGYVKNKYVIRMMLLIDKYSCKKSDLMILPGIDLVDRLMQRFKGKRVPKHILINNWIDEKMIYPLKKDNNGVQKFLRKYSLEDSFIIMYSGNIGLYYDLENIIKVIARFPNDTKTKDGKKVSFVFVGEGGVLRNLKSYTRDNNVSNVIFIPYQDKSDVIFSLNSADVHWCVNAKGIKGVSCPSKYYGIAACSKPVLGVLEKGTEIRSIIEKTCGGLVCEPGEYDEIEKNIKWFIENSSNKELDEMGQRGYEYLLRNLTKEISVAKYKDAILNL